MTTYNKYAEAKIANPTSEIFESTRYTPLMVGKFKAVDNPPTSHFANGWIKCNPADHCMSLKEFFEAGHKFVGGDKWLSRDNLVITIGVHGTVQCANESKIYDNERFVLSAKALEEPQVVEIAINQSNPNDGVLGVALGDSIPLSEFEKMRKGNAKSFVEGYVEFADSDVRVDESGDVYLTKEPKQAEWKNGDPCRWGIYEAVFIGYSKSHSSRCAIEYIKDFCSIIDTVCITDLKKPETPEQKKEREREMAVYDMCSSLDNHSEEARFWAERFYDAGYRKPE